MSDFFPIGPGRIQIGDPTQGAGAGMVLMNEVEEMNADIGIQNSFATTALTAGAPVFEGVYSLPPNPQLACRFNDADLDQLVTLLLGGELYDVAGDEAIGFGGAIEKLTLPTFVFIPEFEKDDGVDAAHAIWFPAAFFEGLNNLLFNRMQANASSNNQYNITVRSARRKADQASQVIPTKAQYGFIGKPAALALGATAWSLLPMT